MSYCRITRPPTATIGNNTITYSILGACTGTTTSVIVVNPLPIANAGPDFTICSATSGNLGAPLTFGNTYLWTPVTGLSSTSIADPTVTLTNSSAAPVTTTYNVLTTIASTGCFANDQVDVVVNPIAAVNAGLDQTICDGNSAILSGDSPCKNSAGLPIRCNSTIHLISLISLSPKTPNPAMKRDHAKERDPLPLRYAPLSFFGTH